MIKAVSQVSSLNETNNIDLLFEAPKVDNIDLLIEVFALMIAQRNTSVNQARELNRKQFTAQMKAALHPRNAAIAMLTMTVVGAVISVFGSVVSNNQAFGNKIGQGLYGIAPGLSSKVFGPSFNVDSFSKILQSGTDATSKVLSGGADASTKIADAMSGHGQAEGTRLQHLYSGASDNKKREMDSADRTMGDIAKILEARAATSRAILGR